MVYGYLSSKDAKGNPKRVRNKFWGKNAKEKAIDHRHKLEVEDNQDALKYQMRNTKLDTESEHVILALIDELREHVGDYETPEHELLRKAVRFFIDSPVKGLDSCKVEEAKNKFLSQEKFLKRSKSHRDGMTRCLERFSALYGLRDIATISDTDIEDWIYRRKPSGDHTKLNEYRFIHAFFAWCNKKAILNRNVVSIVDKPEVEYKEPVSLTIEETRKPT